MTKNIHKNKYKQRVISNIIMDNPKYSNICVDYEEQLKRDCNIVSNANEFHCEQVKKLLEECYKFKEKKQK